MSAPHGIVDEPTDPPWVRIARGEIGQTEHLPGSNPRIDEYRAVVGAPHGTDWCAAFMAWVMREAGYSGPWTAAARSFLHFGEPLESLRPGCVAVFWRGSKSDWRGHVTLALRDGDMISCLGGNQHGSVRISKYPRARLLAYRWPS